MEEKQSFLKQKIDLESPNRNIVPITTSIEGDGKLSVGGCSIEELVKKYDSPLYVLDEITLRNSCKAYKKALEKYYPGKSLPIYASKANSSIFMSSLVSSEGLGLDAVSEGELLTAIKGGVPNEKIVFHGNNKSDKELEFAVRNNIKVIVDNDYDLERLDEISNSFNHDLEIMIRFTPGIECHTHEYIRTGSFDSKFGFGIEYLNILFNRISNTKHLKLKGLHAHIGSQIFELDPHKDLGEIMVKVILDAKKFGHNIEELNVGGGLGIRYTESDDPPSIDEWVKTISSSVVEACKKNNLDFPTLMCEPGRSIVSTAGITIYKIGAFKEIPGIRTYLSVDGGMVKNKFFLQIISNLLEIELNIPEMEDMSSYGALLFGMQYYHNLKNTSDLKDFKVKSSKIIPNIDDTIRNSFISWKEIVDKHFVKNQD